MRKLLFLMVIITIQNKANAFNPVAFVQGVRVVSSIAGTGDLEELAGIGGELVGLLEDLEVDSSSEAEVNQAVQKLEELDGRLKKSRSVHSDMTSVMREDLSRARGLREKIQALKRMIGSTKRIAEIFQSSTKAGSAAADVQSLKINTMILEELQANRRRQDLVQLNETSNKAERLLLMDELRRDYEAKAR